MSTIAERVAARYLKSLELPDPQEGFAYIYVQAAKLESANGQAGSVLTWQGPFPLTTPCVKCRAPARIAMGIRELGENTISHIHENTHHPDEKGEGGFWPHDAIAACLYICPEIECTTATCLWNQA